jgi:hypothetical protein
MAEIIGNGSDNSIKAVQNVPKFDGSNYREWHFELDLAFKLLDLSNIISGIELRPQEVYTNSS